MQPIIESPPCPACGREKIPPPLYYEACMHSKGQVLGLSRCPDCRVHFTRPRLVEHNMQPRQAAYEYILEKYGRAAESGEFSKNSNYLYYLRLAESRLEKAGRDGPYSVLDIGAHCGFFLRSAKERGWQVYGIEPAAPLVRFAHEKNGIDTIRQAFFDGESFSDLDFDLITMFDVLEHLPDPVGILRTALERLRRGGLVICKVPHVQFYIRWRATVSTLGRLGLLPRFPTFLEEPAPENRDSSLSGFFDLFEHLVHYDETAVDTVFKNAGYRDVDILPAPPTNTPGDRLNLPRSLLYHVARLIHLVGKKPGPLTHGLLILASKHG